MICPLCQRPAAKLLRHAYIGPDGNTLARRINATWQPADGLCETCFDVILDTVAQARQPRPTRGYPPDYFRYVLTRRQSRQWHFCQNPDLTKWRRDNIMDAASEAACSAGYDAVLILDCDETMLAQGIATIN